jgi:folate-binding protein YgfZ
MSTGLAPFRTGAAVVHRSDAGVLGFTGPQARWFLDQLLTNRLLELPTGSGADALLLTPKGRITALLQMWATGDEEVVAILDGAGAARLCPFFEGRVFATRVSIADRTGSVSLLTVLGPRAGPVVEDALGGMGMSQPVMLPGDEELANVTLRSGDGSVVVVRATRPVPGYDLLLSAERRAAFVEALVAAGGETRPATELDRLSVVEGLPRFGSDFDERFLPQEAAFERAVHFAKGCYLGQEAVAMAQRGRVKRRLRHLAFDGPSVAGPLVCGGEPAGEVMSLADEDGRGWGIAWVPTAVAVGTTVDVAGGAGAEPLARAEVRELPGTHTGPRAPSARELRERLAGSSPGPSGVTP